MVASDHLLGSVEREMYMYIIEITKQNTHGLNN